MTPRRRLVFGVDEPDPADIAGAPATRPVIVPLGQPSDAAVVAAELADLELTAGPA